MPRPALEVAGIFRKHGARYRKAHQLSYEQLRVMRAIETCRTAALGGHVEKCDGCDFTRNAYNSCRNRHCPKCQSAEREQWLAARKAELLPVEYFHVVFTLPEQIAEIAFYNKETVYGILFHAAAETLLTIARDLKHLGAEIGFFAILHTWGQNLLHHPHLHCVVPGGGLAPDHERWISCLPGFFLPVQVLSRLFRRLFLEHLEDAFYRKQLRFPGSIEPLQDAFAFSELLGSHEDREWVVYAKPPFGGPQRALEYLGRYTHRVALSNHRLLSLEDDRVMFQWKDYRSEHREKSRTMTLGADEFQRRFLIHALPAGFQRIRHYGFLANCHRADKLEFCRELLTAGATGLLPQPDECHQMMETLTEIEPGHRCPQCGVGTMVRTAVLAPIRWPAVPLDTS
jgi:predicted Zn-ribbon and HTH transcriptional regulator